MKRCFGTVTGSGAVRGAVRAAKRGAILVFFMLFYAACEEVTLPKLKKYDVESDIHLTPATVVNPATLSATYAGAQPFLVNVNPDGLTLNAYKSDDGTYMVTLRGAVNCGIPVGLKRFDHPNDYYDSTAAAGTSPEPPAYRYGDFEVQLWNNSTIIDPNYTVREIDVNANPRINGRTKFAVITVSGLLELKDKKGNQRDLSRDVTISQTSEALKLYTITNGGSSGWSYNISGISGSSPVMTSTYTALHPYKFSVPDISGKYIVRGGKQEDENSGGISFLLWEGAQSKTVNFTITYRDTGVTKIIVDYSGVQFSDVPLSTFWFYSDYNYNLPSATPPGTGERLPDLIKILSSDTDPNGTGITGTKRLKAPVYSTAQNATGGPFPYRFPATATKAPVAKEGSSDAYVSEELDVGMYLRLLPVFFPANTSIRAIKWAYPKPDNDDDAQNDTFQIVEESSSLTIHNRAQTPSPAAPIEITATVDVPSAATPMVLKATINFTAPATP